MMNMNVYNIEENNAELNEISWLWQCLILVPNIRNQMKRNEFLGNLIEIYENGLFRSRELIKLKENYCLKLNNFFNNYENLVTLGNLQNLILISSNIESVCNCCKNVSETKQRNNNKITYVKEAHC